MAFGLPTALRDLNTLDGRIQRECWNDYVFEAYVNHQADAIYLAGLPDIPESRPHSKISEAKGWKAPAFPRQN